MEEDEEDVTRLLEVTGESDVDAVDTLGRIHFPLSSSYLHSESTLSRLW